MANNDVERPLMPYVYVLNTGAGGLRVGHEDDEQGEDGGAQGGGDAAGQDAAGLQGAHVLCVEMNEPSREGGLIYATAWVCMTVVHIPDVTVGMD